MAKIFTDSGINKLSDLKTKVSALKTHPFTDTEKSLYSTTMVNNVIQIIDQLINHNEIEDWKSGDNLKSILALIDKLDNGQGTFVPEVFNEESYKLAQILRDALNKINLEKDITAATSMLLNPKNVFNTMVQYLKNKINFYEILFNNKKNDELKTAIDSKISAAFIQFESEIEESLTDEGFEKFKQNYAQFVKDALPEINSLAYVRITNSASFVNAAQPYQLRAKEVTSAGSRGAVIMKVLRNEEDLNKLLQQKQLSLVMDFHNHYSETFDPKAYQEKEAQFLKLIGIFKVEQQKYVKGDDLKGFFGKLKGHNKEKVAALNELNASIDTSVAKLTVKNDALLPTGIRAFDIFESILEAERANEAICTQRNISLGELSKLLTRFKWDFFNLAFNEISEANDSGVGHNLNLYRKYLKLAIPLIIIGNEVKPVKSDDNCVSNTTTSSAPRF